jgi:hypothetical protein
MFLAFSKTSSKLNVSCSLVVKIPNKFLESIKQEVSPHFGLSQFNFAIFFTNWFVLLSWERTVYKVFAAHKANVSETAVWYGGRVNVTGNAKSKSQKTKRPIGAIKAQRSFGVKKKGIFNW